MSTIYEFNLKNAKNNVIKNQKNIMLFSWQHYVTSSSSNSEYGRGIIRNEKSSRLAKAKN